MHVRAVFLFNTPPLRYHVTSQNDRDIYVELLPFGCAADQSYSKPATPPRCILREGQTQQEWLPLSSLNNIPRLECVQASERRGDRPSMEGTGQASCSATPSSSWFQSFWLLGGTPVRRSRHKLVRGRLIIMPYLENRNCNREHTAHISSRAEIRKLL